MGGGGPAGTGQLSVTPRPWVEVWVDGRKITARTPVAGYALPAGTHRIRFVYQPSRFAEERAVTVPKDGYVSVDVDVGSGTIDVRER